MEHKIDGLKNATSYVNKNDGLDQEKLKNLEYSFKSANKEIENLKNDFSKKVEQIMKSIYFKCDKSEVSTLESKLLDNLEDLVQSMYNKFSDKVETNENLQILDKQIKNLFELFVNREKIVETETKGKEEDEAMISRKPLGGISCASCSKQLNNLCNLQAAEYFSWSKLPMRDPTDRISKVGQGFSKMLSTMKTKAEQSKTLKNSKDMKTHLSTTDLHRDTEGQDAQNQFTSTESKSRNKHLSPFRNVDVAQRTARERKVKRLDKVDDEKAAKNMHETYLPTIVKSVTELTTKTIE